MFGENYKAEVFTSKLDDGCYNAKIIKTEGVEREDGSKYIKVYFEVNGNPNAFPNVWFMNDSPNKASGKLPLEILQSMWNKKTTAFFDSFGIPRGEFNFTKWVGKSGEITIQPQFNKPEYSEIVPYKTKPRKRENPAESFANTFSGEVVSSELSSMPF